LGLRGARLIRQGFLSSNGKDQKEKTLKVYSRFFIGEIKKRLGQA